MVRAPSLPRAGHYSGNAHNEDCADHCVLHMVAQNVLGTNTQALRSTMLKLGVTLDNHPTLEHRLELPGHTNHTPHGIHRKCRHSTKPQRNNLGIKDMRGKKKKNKSTPQMPKNK